jgi:hypothetical protein
MFGAARPAVALADTDPSPAPGGPVAAADGASGGGDFADASTTGPASGSVAGAPDPSPDPIIAHDQLVVGLIRGQRRDLGWLLGGSGDAA